MGDAGGSPVLWPGTQVLVGKVAQTADYYTRSIPATAATRAILVYDAKVPSGATVTPQIQIDGGGWETIDADGITQLGDGLVEYRFKRALTGADLVKIKLTLTGNLTARPEVSNIRLMAVA